MTGAKKSSSVRSPESTIRTRDSLPISPGRENACSRTSRPRNGVMRPIIASFLGDIVVALKNLSPWIKPRPKCKLGANQSQIRILSIASLARAIGVNRQVFLDRLRNLVEVALVFLRQQDRADTGAVRGDDLVLDPADGQVPGP